MRIVLLITLVESALVAVLMLVWHYRKLRAAAPILVGPTNISKAQPSGVDSTHDARWAFINEWRVEPQADDRLPTSGKVGHSTETASGRRSNTRRRHQAMFKQWSQDRHD